MADLDDPRYAPAAIMARQNTMIGVTIAMTLVGALAVGLRVFTRAYIVGTMWADDWAMIAALVFAFAYALEVIIAAKSFNAGFSGTQLSTSDMEGIIKITTAIVVTYKLVLTLTKVSILCFYLRIAVRPTFERLSKWTMGVVVLFHIIFTFGAIGQCVPIEKMWDLTGTAEGKCINVNAFFLFASIFHIVTDVWILFLPIKVVISIPRPLKEKFGLFGIFSLGFITVTAASFRLQFLHKYTQSADPFFEILPINMWSMVEVNIGILCASMPTLRPLFSAAQRSRTRAVHGFSLHSKGKGTPGAATGATMTSGTIAVGIGTTIRGSWKPPPVGIRPTTTIRGSWKPPVPPKSPSYAGSNFGSSSSPTYLPTSNGSSPVYNKKLSTVFDGDTAPLFSNGKSGRYSSRAFETDLERNISNGAQPKRLALLRRDENGIFRPEAVYQQ